MPYIVNKALKVQTRFKNRSEKGLKQLKEMKSDEILSKYRRISLQTIFNPEDRKLDYKFKNHQ